MLITSKGTMLRTAVEAIKTTGRNTQGVRVIKVKEGERVGAVAHILAKEEDVE
jgi:DNA gyrase subunit A